MNTVLIKERRSTARLLGSSSIYRMIFDFVLPLRRIFIISALFMPLAIILQLLQPYLIKITIDRYISVADFHGVFLCSGLYLLCFAAEGCANFLQLHYLAKGSQLALHHMRERLLGHILRLPLSYFDQAPIGVLVSRVTNDVESINELLVSGIVSLIKDFILLIAILAMLLHLQWKLALISFVLLPPMLAVVYYFQHKMRIASIAIRKVVGKINGFLSESLNGIAIIKLFQRESRNLEDFNLLNAEHKHHNTISVNADASLYSVVEAFATIITATVIWYGSKMLDAPIGLLTLGTLVAFIEYLNRFFNPLRDISGKFATLQMALAAGDRIVQLFSEKTETSPPTMGVLKKPQLQGARKGPSEAYSLATLSERPVASNAADGFLQHSPNSLGVEFSHVNLKYDNGEQVLHDINLLIKPGMRVALVGATGSGKTSLARLLLRFYQVQSGNIYFNLGNQKYSIQDLPLHDIRRLIAMVPQDVELFHGTAAENIMLKSTVELSNDAIDLQKTTAILQKLHITQHFNNQTEIAERGNNLSAGQKQLLALARVLYYDPLLVILDEATASIDTETENSLLLAMDIALKNRTALIIAHRLSTIQTADLIVVMNKGRIINQGTHTELLKSSPIYQTLVQDYIQSI